MDKIVLIVSLSAVVWGQTSTISTNGRIIGGSVVPEAAIPYQVSIRYSKGEHICSGSIISTTDIVTAAHCVAFKSPTKLSVIAGTNQLGNGGTRFGVSGIKIHERYNWLTLNNDIALVKVSSPIFFSSRIDKILPETSFVGSGADALLSGWGNTLQSKPYSNDLQYVLVKTISVADCKRLHAFSRIGEAHLCTLAQRGQGACYGDGGSPVVVGGYLAGIVSWGKPCARNYPDVHVRVSYYMDWITKNSN